jgi:hypothetical protein
VGFFSLNTKLMVVSNPTTYKAHLLGKGFWDFFEAYSLVVKPIIIHAMLSLVISTGYCIRKVDASNAFLHNHLQETIYMSQPPRFVNPMFPDFLSLEESIIQTQTS